MYLKQLDISGDWYTWDLVKKQQKIWDFCMILSQNAHKISNQNDLKMILQLKSYDNMQKN